MNKYEIFLKSGQSFEVSFDGDLVQYIWDQKRETEAESFGFAGLGSLKVDGGLLIISQIVGIKHLSATWPVE